MKVKGKDPKEIVLSLLKRSDCAVQVAAVLSDPNGVYAWGWNHMGQDGLGECAEQAAFRRANYKRIKKSVIWIAGRRKKSKNPVCSKPCALCWQLVKNCAYIMYMKKDGSWETLRGEW